MTKVSADYNAHTDFHDRDFDYVEFARVLRDAGQTEGQIETHVRRIHIDLKAEAADAAAAAAQQATIEGLGLKVNTRHHLLRVSNVRWAAGRLHDGTMHYQWQTVIAGSTYPHRAALKAAGYCWDAAAEVWARPMAPHAGSIADHLTAAREMVAGWAGLYGRKLQK